MRALVLGALLVQTLHAQQVSDDFTDAGTTGAAISDITADVDTTIDADVDAAASVTVDASGSETTPDPFDYTSELGDYTSTLPVGTADVIVSTSTASDDADAVPTPDIFDSLGATPTDDASAFATPDPNGAIVFDGTDWTFPPESVSTDSEPDFLNGFAVSTPSEDPAADPAATGRVDEDSDFAAAATDGGEGGDDATATVELEFPYTTDYADAAAPTSLEVVLDADGIPVVSDTATADAGLAASETFTDDFSDATSTSLPIDDDSGLFNQPPLPDTATSQDSNAPLITPSVADASSGAGAQDYNNGTSSAIYDGQDYDTTPDDSECPWWCLGGVNNNGSGYTGSYPSDIASPSSGSGGDGTDYPDDGDQYAGGDDGSSSDTEDGTDYSTDTYPSVRRFLRRALRKRQSNGFAAFNWPSASTPTAVSQEVAAAAALPSSADYRSGCPASCYGSSSFAGGSSTTGTGQSQLTRRPLSTSTMSYEYGSGYDNSSFEVLPTAVPISTCGYGFSAACSDDSTPSLPSASQPAGTNTDASTLLTLPSPSILPSSSSPLTSYPASPPAGANASPSGVDYTGDTLASVCPLTCNATYPNLNFCDITTSCTTTGGAQGRTYCACRAGYRASRWNEKDFTKQFQVPGQPYVYVAPGVVCDEVCGDIMCSEVLERPLCQ
ncbi:hypothetical protein P3342_008466 [Pyrenophora teres f. teres]|uniref:EGF-like domain-containing protein n=1 Tax=Pyrenophora teres f. teres TaxID=97479 RepID=A0A6S6W912_9PLEO|nr:hypothetical protein HRS9122_09392 [Pyrenophora teres f. teres]KAE8830597.1 hypothetical protein PTNB85_07184 [Pyrenophora teres f. teres]KAE8857402.1 hypothetical protein PTNB29_08469 [Pyrenophora teres f. teres]KAE8863249.1 hypothetical protein PTNB73_06456 [Pyrenophora teres f. teres]KAK1910587.1 hypothetical protein P3342_008466 [Pyrenophora teres f. teres]